MSASPYLARFVTGSNIRAYLYSSRGYGMKAFKRVMYVVKIGLAFMRLLEGAREDGVITLAELTSMATELIEIAGLEGQVIIKE